MIGASAAAFLVAATAAMMGAGPTVRVSELASRPDLIGQEITVEGRSPHYSYTRGGGWNEVDFPGSPVLFRLPPRPEIVAAPRQPPVLRIEGVLTKEGTRLVLQGRRAEELPSDDQRLRLGVAALGARDRENREGWARWALARAEEHQDDALKASALAVRGEALRIEAQSLSDRQVEPKLALAERGRADGIPAPEPEVLAHEAFRSLLTMTSSAPDLAALADRCRKFFADTPRPIDAARAEARTLRAAYENDIAGVYRAASPETRVALDRVLLGDVLEKSLRAELAADPKRGIELADRAEREVPDRAELARTLRKTGLDSEDVGSLRLAEVKARSEQYEDLGLPDQAQDLLRRWLKNQRTNRLSPSDTEGRALLASQYESLIGDRVTAGALLMEAAKLDPGSREVTDALRRRGFRKVGDTWEPPSSLVAEAAGPADAAAAATAGASAGAVRRVTDAMVGLTRDEVRAQLGKPDHVARVLTQGQLLEQWIYRAEGNRPGRYLDFLVKAGGTGVPTVVASGSLRP
jgi:tetratricopeptide (TPR) repeat protein